MFGYVSLHKPELKIREYERYRAYYCGTCMALKKAGMIPGQLTLSYDMTFLSMLLTSLYECRTGVRRIRCPLHPVHRQAAFANECIRYAADMNILLSYYNLLDNWKDDRNLASRLHAGTLRMPMKRIREEWPVQYEAVVSYVRDLSALEADGKPDLDTPAGLTGRMLGTVYAWRDDVWKEDLYRLGFYLGKFIYLIDAWEDLEKDRAKGHYNPWRPYSMRKDFPEFSGQVLEMMMTEASLAFERLPLLRDREIMRNILYAGVWTKYDQKNSDRKIKDRNSHGHV